MKYKVGDKVRIVKNRTENMSPAGLMDCWLGQDMTIEKIFNNRTYCMKEDSHYWSWDDDMIEGRVEDNSKEEEHSSDYYLFKYLSMKLSEKEAQLNAQLSEIKKIQKEIKEVLDNES